MFRGPDVRRGFCRFCRPKKSSQSSHRSHMWFAWFSEMVCIVATQKVATLRKESQRDVTRHNATYRGGSVVIGGDWGDHDDL